MSLRLLSVCFAFGSVVLFLEVGVWITPLDDGDLGTPSLGVTTYAGKVLDPVSDQSLRAAKSAGDAVSGHFLASQMYT